MAAHEDVIIMSLGDRYGVGPEIVARIAAAWEESASVGHLCIVGDARVLEDAQGWLNLTPCQAKIDNIRDAQSQSVSLIDRPFDIEVGPLGKVCANAGRECLEMLDFIAEMMKADTVSAAIYAPLNKQAMREAGHASGDELDYLMKHFSEYPMAGEINALDQYWTARVTSHVPLREVADNITFDTIERASCLLDATLRASGVKSPKIAVAGLNPHAGEGGVFGDEEIVTIGPAIAALRKEGMDVFGPLPPDTVFPQAAALKADGILTMYHDQGQIALKMNGLGRSVTIIGGLPVPVATPGHGTAYDIVGQGIAKIAGMQATIEICRTIAAYNRSINETKQ